MTKEELRSLLKQGRLGMSLAEVTDKSRQICSRVLQNIDWSAVNNLHIYSSVEEWHEVDTKDLVRQLSQRWPDMKIVQPPLMRENPLPKEVFDVIIVPVLGFDKDRNRLGLGGGWYDRFLAAQPQAYKVGLAFQSAYVERGLPHEAHDISLDKIITEV